MKRTMLRNGVLGGAAALALTLGGSGLTRAADPAPAAEPADPPALKSILRQELPKIPGNTMTVFEVDMPPGSGLDPHEHGAFAFVYVLAGQVRSQLGDGSPGVYKAGEIWTEAPGTPHKVFENASKTEHARVLVVFAGPTDARLTTFR